MTMRGSNKGWTEEGKKTKPLSRSNYLIQTAVPLPEGHQEQDTLHGSYSCLTLPKSGHLREGKLN